MNQNKHITLFGVPVRFDVSFLFLVAFLGYMLFMQGGQPHGIQLFVAWVPIVTLSILLHELGHALTGRLFGVEPFVVLHGMGGHTHWEPTAYRKLSHGKRMLATAAGPFAGILVGALIMGGLMVAPDEIPPLLAQGLSVAVWTTLGWGVLNLIPMLPLDGGHLVATMLERFFGLKGVRFARLVSIAIALVLGGLLYAYQGFSFNLLILGWLAYRNYQGYQLEKRWIEDRPLEEDISAGYAALEREEFKEVLGLCSMIEFRAKTPESKGHLAHLRAWSLLLTDDPAGALTALRKMPASERPDALLEGSVLLANGQPGEALDPLREAFEHRGDETVTARLAQAILEAGRVDEISAILETAERAERLGAGPLQLLAHEIYQRGGLEEARSLYEQLFELFTDPLDAFNIGCITLKMGERASALGWLTRAVDAGLPDPSVLKTDQDLADLHDSAEFEALMARAMV